MHVAATQSQRDSIDLANRKAGMIVVTADSGKLWLLNNDLTTWREFSGGSTYSGVLPITVLINGQISIDPKVVLPEGGNPGDIIALGNDKIPVWKTFSVAGNAGVRQTGTYTAPTPISPSANHEFFLQMSKTILLLYLKVDAPDIKVEAFSTPERDEANPYTFITTHDVMEDAGISILPDGTQFMQRRYSILANMEKPDTHNIIYWKLTNQSTIPVTPTFTYNYLILE